MTHIDAHIAFCEAHATLECLGIRGPEALYQECKRLIRKGNAARRASDLGNASKLFRAARDMREVGTETEGMTND